MNNEGLIECIVNSGFGIYIPNVFIERCYDTWNGITEDDKRDLSNPENENYWEAWDDVLRNAYWRDENGFKWTLWENDDLFMIREDFEFED